MVTLRGTPSPPAPQLKPASELLAGPGTDYVGEIARFQSPHDLVSSAHLLPDGRRRLLLHGRMEKTSGLSPTTPPSGSATSSTPRIPANSLSTPRAEPGFTLSRDGPRC